MFMGPDHPVSCAMQQELEELVGKKAEAPQPSQSATTFPDPSLLPTFRCLCHGHRSVFAQSYLSRSKIRRCQDTSLSIPKLAPKHKISLRVFRAVPSL